MDHKFAQSDIAFCKQHPQKLINCIYYKKDCPYSSRLACIQCMKKYNTFEGFEDVVEVLNDPKVIMNNNLIPKGKFNQLDEYLNFLEQNPEESIGFIKEEIFKYIDKLVNDLKQKLSSEIAKVRLQFSDALGCVKFRQAFKDILKVNNYHESEEWKKFEETIQEFVLQFEEIKNEKLQEAYYKLKYTQNYFQTQLLSDFKSSISTYVELVSQNLTFLGFSSLCPQFYFDELIQRIQNKKTALPKISLIFKASKHGMNAQAFWGKCSNQGPTLTICKSKNGCVFGGYSPCKWIPNSAYSKDDSKTSFLFSYTRKEIYSIVSKDHAIYCKSDYGPTFGGGHNLNIAADFQSGYSLMSNSFYSYESFKIDNRQTHLMGDTTPQLVEMEVFLMELN